MEINEIDKILGKTDFPSVYNVFREKQDPPYLCWIIPGETGISADNINYVDVKRVQIELYTATKNVAAENKVESVLTGAGLFYVKTHVYLKDEKIYVTYYEIEVL